MAPVLRRLMPRRILSVALAFTLVGAATGVALAASVLVRDTTDVRLRVIQSEFADGFDSGWHTHPGMVIVQVQQGKFKIYQGSCKHPTVVEKGETYLEIPFVPVRAVAKGEVKWTTTQILPAGEDPLTSVSSPC